jgi:hypothetical protein
VTAQHRQFDLCHILKKPLCQQQSRDERQSMIKNSDSQGSSTTDRLQSFKYSAHLLPKIISTS